MCRTTCRILPCWLLGVVLLLPAVPARAAERYVIATEQSRIQFQAYSLFTDPVGEFHRFAGEIVADPENLGVSHVRLSIEAASIDTQNTKRDRHLRSEGFFFVAQYPEITFESTAIRRNDAGYLVQGDLSMRGVTKRIEIPVSVERQQGTITVRGSVRLNRQEFKIDYNAFFNPIRDRVDVSFTIVGVAP
jgi:polyisoprenoid-binding protein YceI